MNTEQRSTEQKHPKTKVMRQGGDAVYGIGLIGAWVYYLRRATTLREGVEGFLKGIFWPAFMVYDLLIFLHKS